MTTDQLEQAALDAHRRGDTWITFWLQHCGDMQAAAHRATTPWGRSSALYHSLVARLRHLVTAGGMTAADQ